MNKNLHNSRGSSTHVGNQNPRWRTVFIALMLALAIGSASQPALAQEPDPDVSVVSKIEAGIPQDICVDEIGSVKVRVVRTLIEKATGWQLRIWRPGIPINATSEDTSIASLLQPSQITGFNPDLPLEAEFDYRGEKEGTTTLTFAADDLTGLVGEEFDSIYSNKVTISISVKVIPCAFKAKVVLSFNPGIYNIDVISDNALMVRDEAGTFTGSTVMHWVYSNFSIPCLVSATDSAVDLTGRLSDDGGQFMGSLTFGPNTVSGCKGSAQGTVSPLQFSVASSGGVSTSTVTAQPLSGSATIVVVPEEGQAVFMPGDHEASLDDFLSLFDVLLALH